MYASWWCVISSEGEGRGGLNGVADVKPRLRTNEIGRSTGVDIAGHAVKRYRVDQSGREEETKKPPGVLRSRILHSLVSRRMPPHPLVVEDASAIAGRRLGRLVLLLSNAGENRPWQEKRAQACRASSENIHHAEGLTKDYSKLFRLRPRMKKKQTRTGHDTTRKFRVCAVLAASEQASKHTPDNTRANTITKPKAGRGAAVTTRFHFPGSACLLPCLTRGGESSHDEVPGVLEALVAAGGLVGELDLHRVVDVLRAGTAGRETRRVARSSEFVGGTRGRRYFRYLRGVLLVRVGPCVAPQIFNIHQSFYFIFWGLKPCASAANNVAAVAEAVSSRRW